MTDSPAPAPNRSTLFLVLWVGLTALAVIGILALIYWVVGQPRESAPAPTATLVALAPTRVVLPTRTLIPTLPPTHVQPTATRPPTETAATLTPTVSSPTLTINLPANVRNGPGLNYPVIAGLEVGATPLAVGRDTSATWFVISDPSIRGGQGWVADLVATYSGDIRDLPVVRASPPPPTPVQSTPTAVPNPNPGPIAGSRGLSGQLTLCNPKTAYATGERVCFVEKIVNTTSGLIKYGVLGVQAANLSGGPSQFQTSWSGDLWIDPGCTGPTDHCGGAWEDGVRLNTPGAYRLSLQVCYSPLNVCTTPDGEWETISTGIDITVN